MNNNEYLALGSLVQLKTNKLKVLIIGVCQKSNNKSYDYAGCAHPFGYTSSENIILFNKNEIDKVLHEGYFDDDTKDFYEDLEWEKQRSEKNEN